MKKVLVTGANKGIGFGISRHLGMLGWHILLGARDEIRAKAAIEKLKKDGIKDVEWVKIDLCSQKSMEQSVEMIKKNHSDLSLLVNNAGIPGNMACPSYESNINDVIETVQVNYIGTYFLTMLLVPVIAANHGRIVNITVPTNVNPYWNPMAYKASKAAQNVMTETMAFDFQKNNIPIETYCIHPGPTTTDLNGNMALPGFHMPDLIGENVAAIVEDGKCHQGEFIELYPIVEE